MKINSNASHTNNTDTAGSRDLDITSLSRLASLVSPPAKETGLASLSDKTISLIKNSARSWGFDGLPLAVRRHKLDDNLWKLTVENPKTRTLIMEVEGNGDKVFAYEDSLAKLAHALITKDLKITTFES